LAAFIPVKGLSDVAEKSKAGRKSKLLEGDTEKLLLNAIRMGLTFKDAATVAKITERTFFNWIEKGRNAKSGKYFQFLQSLERAKAEGQAAVAQTVIKAAQGGLPIKETKTRQLPDGSIEVTVIEKVSAPNVTAAMFILERRYPDEWGRKETVKLEGDPEKPIAVAIIHGDAPTDEV
jgi:transposase